MPNFNMGIYKKSFVVASLALALASSEASAALSVEITGDLSSGDTIVNIGGDNYYYDIFSFIAPDTGLYDFTMSSNQFDAFLELYASPFTNPTSIINADYVIADDDSGVGGWRTTFAPNPGNSNAAFSFNLNAGSTYFLASTSVASIGDTVVPFSGNYVTTISGPVAAIPEPQTFAMFLAGLGLLGFAARRNKS